MVNLKTDGITGLRKALKKKKLACFGAGKHFETVMCLYSSYHLEQCVEYIVDNDSSIYNTFKNYQGTEYRIISLKTFESEEDIENTVLLITSHMYCMEIVSQLDHRESLNGMDVYIGSFLSEDTGPALPYGIGGKAAGKIPKIIHYCWFGRGEIPYEYQQYMNTWRRYCTDYEIWQWNEDNFDISANKYMRQAYEQGKWAFVSDYARIKIIYDYGGIYLDCDVELLKSLDDFLGESMFCGFEDRNHINLGLGFGAVKKHPYLKKLMDYYGRLEFVNLDGSFNMVPCTAYQTAVIKEFGIRDDNIFQRTNGITVYPTEVFSPISCWGMGTVSDGSYSVHHYHASWQPQESIRKVNHVYREYCRRKMKCIEDRRGFFDQHHSSGL